MGPIYCRFMLAQITWHAMNDNPIPWYLELLALQQQHACVMHWTSSTLLQMSMHHNAYKM